MAVVLAKTAVASAATASSTAVAAGTFCKLDAHAFTIQTLAVQVLDCVLGIADVLKLDKSETPLEDDIAKASVTIEESFQIRLASAGRQSADEQTSAHCYCCL